MIRLIKENTSSYDENMQKIQYYAKRVMDDINKAAKILESNQVTLIECPEIYGGDEYFYEWYKDDYIALFDDSYPGCDIKEIWKGNSDLYFDVICGYFSASDLEDVYGDTVDYLMQMVEDANHMEDLYMVTYEYDFTIQDLANDPYKVFEHWDDEDKVYYAEEVSAEFDLWTQSDRVYDIASDAQKFMNVYNDVENYFSYDNAEQCLKDYNGLTGYED